MTDPKPVSRFESLYHGSAANCHSHYDCSAARVSAFASTAYTTLPARHTISTSPARRVVHDAEPIVERVVEVENMMTPELMARAAASKTEAEEMRIRMKEYETLSEAYSALSAQFSNQCQANYQARTDYDGQIADLSVQIHTNATDLAAGQYRLENTRRHISLLTESHQRTVANVATTDGEIVKVKDELVKLAADRATMDTRHGEQVTELNGLYEANHKTAIELHDQHVLNNTKSVELHQLQAQVSSMEAQSHCLSRRIDDLNACLTQRTTDVTQHEARLAEMEAEIVALAASIAATQAKVDVVNGLIATQVEANGNLQNQIHNESVKNMELSANINDLQARSHSMESRLACMRNEVEAFKSSNGVFLDQNSNLQTQVTTMKGHNAVVVSQNTMISNELQTFINANEAMRVQLDRRSRVIENCRRNEESIASSAHSVHRSRSPVKRTYSALSSCCHHAPVVTTHVPLYTHLPPPAAHWQSQYGSHTRSYTSHYATSSPLLRTSVAASPAPVTPAPASPALAAPASPAPATPVAEDKIVS